LKAMVVALGPGKFYGSSLPRPRFYTDVKFGPDRVDPPAPVMDPFLSWAGEAHWSMGGLSFKRLRLQGRIEGNIKRLRAHHKRSDRDRIKKSKIRSEEDKIRKLDEVELEESGSDSEPEPERESQPDKAEVKGRKRRRKLVDEFERVFDADRVGHRTRSKEPEFDKASEAVKARRTSPRKKSVA